MQQEQRASAASLRILTRSGCYLQLLFSFVYLSFASSPFSFAWASPTLHRQGFTGPVAALQPEALLDHFVCAPRLSSKTEVDGRTAAPDDEAGDHEDEEDDKFRVDWQPQVPCVDSQSVNVFALHRVEPGNVWLMSDIDDTLIASGGWTWIGKSLGGTDDRYARGSDYPGFAGLLYLLGLGPHLRDATTGELKVYKPPLQIAVVTGRPNISFFRPDYLLPHIDAILTRGVRQITNDEDWQWKVGTENNMLSSKMLKGLHGRGEMKVSFGLDAIRRKEPLDGSRINAETKVMFVGDTGERDPEVALALATAEPGALVAVFINVVRRSGDPHWRQSVHEDADEDDFQPVDDLPLRALPGTKGLSTLGHKLASALHDVAAKLQDGPEGSRKSGQRTGNYTPLEEDIELQSIDSERPGAEGTKESRFAGDGGRRLQEEAEEEPLPKIDAKRLGAALVQAGEELFRPLTFDANSATDAHWEPQRHVFRGDQEDKDSEAEAVAEAAEGDDGADTDSPVQRTVPGSSLRSSRRKHVPPRVTISDALADTKRFAIRVGDNLVDAIQVVYDVHISTDSLEGPQTCSAFNARQAYAVATKVGQKLRNIWDVYEHRWKHTPDAFNVAAPGIAGLSASRERKRRPLPLIFVRCNKVHLHITNPPAAHNWRRFWNFFTESSERIDVRFIVENESIEQARGLSSSTPGEEQGDTIFVLPEQLNKPTIGTPVAPYTTTLSAAAHAYVLGLIDLIDVSTIVRKTHEALRSQGPLSRSARLPALLDHLYDLEGLKDLLFSRGAPESGLVRDVSDLIDSLLISQYAFAKRAAYVRAFPSRQQECVHDLQRSLLEVGRGAAMQRSGSQCNQGRLVAFGTPFAAFVCEYDLEMASLQFAGAAELVGLSVTLNKVVREALAVTERGSCDEASATSKHHPHLTSADSRKDGVRALDELDSFFEDTEDRCTLPPEKVQRFRDYYNSMCQAFASIACQLLKARLSTPVLEDLLLLAESRAANRSDAIDLPHFGLRVLHDEDVQEYFENLHQRPAAQLLGFIGNPVDYALQPIDETKGYFEKWPGVDSINRWKSIAETLGHLLHCKLIS